MKTLPSRRKFLKETVFGVVALSAARLIPLDYASAAVPSEIEGQLLFFSPMEFLIVQMAARRIVGDSLEGNPGPDEVGVALKADRLLAASDVETQDQFHELLTIFNGALFAFIFDFRFTSFVNMSAESQDSYLESWMTSIFSFRRSAFQALKRITLGLFYTDSRSWKEIGYDGMFLPWERTKQ
ncbi:MAG TPA: gluconate 2-dehydrogenase subunit 3 family protein [Bacteroidota bacterium]|nr:gluconate 2-dehydrogenase subunit 3 family protein [Bacteroidota bacterium]